MGAGTRNATESIRKSFSGVSVLKGVQLTVESGEVHALLGENGASKSTLMNILTGVLPRDGGTIEFDGQNLEHITITQSEKLGIAFVHQELNLFNDLKVFENMFLNREYTNKMGMLDKKRMRAEAKELFERLGVEIDPDAVVSDLKTSQKQLLEICKALHLKAKLIILDEPTTSLNNEEVDHLFGILRKLKAEGTSFIFISHKMPEIFALADRYTVFRNGEYIGEGKISETTPEKVTVMMVGESYSNAEVYEKRALGEEVLKLEGFTGDGFHDISLSVKKGEIVGMTGLQGSGSSEMLQAIFGSTRATEGTVTAFGKSVPHNSIHGAMKAGIAMLPNNRKENSVLPDMSLMENMAISEQTLSAAKLPVDAKRDKKRYDEYKQMLGIKAQNSTDLITSLSGGNQQKIFIARWLNTDAEILILDNPTQGIDVGAKAEIYRLILELAKAAKMSGINVSIMKISAFTICGILTGLGAFLWIAMNGSADPATTGNSYEMYAIASVVLGGIAMSGGRGKMLGVLFGAMSYTIVDKIIVALKMDSLINNAIKGIILILVILVQVAGPQIREKFRKAV